MNQFLSNERFKLELHWQEALYEIEAECCLKGAYFSGPAMQMAQEINQIDSMMLDLYSQYLHLVKGAYVLTLSWKGVIYDGIGKAFLKDAKLTKNEELNTVPILNNNDYFVIDTRDHEASIHHFHFLYKSVLVNETDTLYRFGK